MIDSRVVAVARAVVIIPRVAYSMTRMAFLAGAFTIAACSGGSAPPEAPANRSACSIPIAPMRVQTDDSKVDFVIETDGTMRLDGRVVGKIVCDEARDATGAPIVVVKPDGSVMGGLMVPGKFVGDELVAKAGDKTMRISVDDAGLLTMAIGPEESTMLYRGGGQSKRAAIVSWLILMHVGHVRQMAPDGGTAVEDRAR